MNEPIIDESFTTLLVIGILLITDRIDLAAAKAIFARSVSSIPFSELIELPEYTLAWDRINAAAAVAEKAEPIDLSAGLEPKGEVQ
jgi:hypothetical protein